MGGSWSSVASGYSAFVLCVINASIYRTSCIQVPVPYLNCSKKKVKSTLIVKMAGKRVCWDRGPDGTTSLISHVLCVYYLTFTFL